jgi:hypothetical protein
MSFLVKNLSNKTVKVDNTVVNPNGSTITVSKKSTVIVNPSDANLKIISGQAIIPLRPESKKEVKNIGNLNKPTIYIKNS